MYRMLSLYGIEKLSQIISALPKIMEKPYSPVITSPTELENKMGKLIIFIRKEKTESRVAFMN